MKDQGLYLQDSKKDDEVAVPVCAQEHERYYSTPPHPFPPVTDHERAVPVLQDSKKDDDVAVRVGAREHERYYPTPPNPTPLHRSLIMKEQCLCLQDSKKDDEVAVPVCAQEHERHYHPTRPKRYAKGMILWCSK